MISSASRSGPSKWSSYAPMGKRKPGSPAPRRLTLRTERAYPVEKAVRATL